MENDGNNQPITPDSWQLFEEAVAVVPRIYLWGPPGIGKSHAGLDALWKIVKGDVWPINLNEDTVVQELLGHFIPEGNVFRWHNGPVALAFGQGGGLVVNELGRSTRSVQDMFLGILDDPAIALLSLPTGERIKRADGFRVVATANTPPDDLDEALRDRFDTVLHMTTPHPGIVRRLNELLSGLGAVVEDSYKDTKRAISPRRALAFLELRKKMIPTPKALRLAFGEQYADIHTLLKARGVLSEAA